MKNRFLRFTFIVLLSGLTSVIFALSVNDNDGSTTDKTNKMTSADYFTKVRSNQATASLSIMDILQARAETQAMKSHKSTAANYHWTSMGPNNMAGPTKAVIFDNRDASNNTLYAGSTTGGLWFSTNYGNVWEKVVTDEVLNVSTICQAADGTIYVGTGVSLEPSADKIAEGSTIGKGIFKSTSGNSFQLMPGTAPTGDDVAGDWAFIQKIAVDASGKIYAATNTGLKYFDGANWVYAISDGVELLGKSCDVVFYDGVIVAAVAGNTYVSTAGFTDFVLRSSEEAGLLPTGAFGSIKYAVSEANSNYIYASYVDADGALFNVYVSTDKGLTWRIVYPGGSNISDIFNGQGLRNNCVAVQPNDEKTVYIGAYDIYKGYEAQPTGYYSWQQITNGDDDPFSGFNSVYLHFGINAITFHPTAASNVVFATDGGMGITKDNFTSLQLLNRLYNTTGYFTINANKSGDVIAGSQFNGVHLIKDNGSSQAYELLLNNSGGPSPLTGGYNHISFINPEFYVCSAADGTFWRSEDAGVNVNTGILDGVKIGNEFLSPFLMWETPSTIYTEDSVKFIAKKDYNTGDELWATSHNYDFPFQTIAPSRINEGDTLMIKDLVQSRCFIATEGKPKNDVFEGGVYMTTGMLDYTAAPVWWQIGAVEGIPTCMAYSKDANYIWVGTLEGRLFRLSNVLRAVNQESADINSPGCIIAITEINLATTQAITSVAIDAKNSENVIITLGNYGNSDYAFACEDGMSDEPEFTSIQGNLPEMPVYASSFEVNNDGLVFIGTENGLFYTENYTAASVNWIYEDSGFGDVPVFSIRQQNVNWPSIAYPVNDDFNLYYPGATNYGAIYVGTFGAGAYVTKDFVGFEEIAPAMSRNETLKLFPNPANNAIQISYESQMNGLVSLDIFDLSGKLVVNHQYQVNKGQVSLDVELSQLENGSYIVRLQDGQYQHQTKLVISK